MSQTLFERSRAFGGSAFGVLIGSAAVFFGASCSDDSADCDSVISSTCDIRSEACQRRVFNRMRCIRDQGDQARRPPVALLSRAEVRELFISAADDEEVDDSRAHTQNVLVMLGLSEPSEGSLDGGLEVALEGLLGLYSPEADAIVVVESDAIEFDSVRSMATLAHEYVHSLQHADFSLVEYRSKIVDTFDSSLAATSVIEGEAALFESFFEVELSGLSREQIDWRGFFEQLTDAADELTIEGAGPADTAFSVFPYTYGGHTSRDAFDSLGLAALRDTDAPLTQGYLALRHEADTVEEVRRVNATGNPPGFELIERDTLGAWLLHGFLMSALGEEPRPRLALGWRGDALSVFGSDTLGSGAIWSIRWRRAALATEFVALLDGAESPGGGVWGAHQEGVLSHVYVADGGIQTLALFEAATRLPAEETATQNESEVDAGSAGDLQSGLRSLIRQRARSCLIPPL